MSLRRHMAWQETCQCHAEADSLTALDESAWQAEASVPGAPRRILRCGGALWAPRRGSSRQPAQNDNGKASAKGVSWQRVCEPTCASGSRQRRIRLGVTERDPVSALRIAGHYMRETCESRNALPMAGAIRASAAASVVGSPAVPGARGSGTGHAACHVRHAAAGAFRVSCLSLRFTCFAIQTFHVFRDPNVSRLRASCASYGFVSSCSKRPAPRAIQVSSWSKRFACFAIHTPHALVTVPSEAMPQ
jgi:hypothetical protein